MSIPPKQWRRIQKAVSYDAVGPAGKARSKRARKKARRAASGIRLSPSLTVCIQRQGAEPMRVHDPTRLVILPSAK
jgi:hypothetical protein